MNWNNRDDLREYGRLYRIAHKHPCPVCGILIASASQHCRRHRIMPTGEMAYNWRGGRVNNSGYLMIRNPSHPRADKSGYVREHILVWEQSHNNSLPMGWVVHHLNGIKRDNRPCNLVALPNKKHKFILAEKAKRIQELEAILAKQGSLL